jgi:hypothetical protein
MNNGIANRVLHHTVNAVAAALKIPPLALKMFRLADEMSGLNEETVPRELIPLNAVQLTRGLLNYAALQSLPGWIFPYWAEKQFDPSDPGFIPRSHLGLSVNVTRRNWTAVGSPECTVEPVVDPRGAVMPFRNRWSIDFWVKTPRGVFFPSRLPDVRQQLLEGLPIVETNVDCEGIRILETAYVDGRELVVNVTLDNLTGKPEDLQFAFAVRPFNPEGLAVVHRIEFDPAANSFMIDVGETLHFAETPHRVCCSNKAGGDSARSFATMEAIDTCRTAFCDVGLANAYAAFSVALGSEERKTLSASVLLEKRFARDGRAASGVAGTTRVWKGLLSKGGDIVTPDERLNLLLRSSLCTLLLLTDDTDITPGPWTYHQFWFRDAAFMLLSLDVFGYHEQAGHVIREFPARQDRSGYFRSQQGEWDSTGQALWTIWQHALLSGDVSIAAELFASMRRGIDWIRKNRVQGSRSVGKPYSGLMPPGLSAEHLGLCDYYFYDNWWSVAGIQSFVRLARWLGENKEAEAGQSLLDEYRASIAEAIRHVQHERGMEEIPAGPLRGVDSGMIGSCVAWYPLQELSPEDKAMRKTLATLGERFSWDGLFFQDFIHSGGNPYLTLQVAQAWLYGGERSQFWRLFTRVADSASATMNYPEAIHPRTGGGTMGDGHHGWAAAEVAMALRSALVQEYWKPGDHLPELVFLGGIPPEWCTSGKQLCTRRLPVPGGLVSLELSSSRHESVVDITFEENQRQSHGVWTVKLPRVAAGVTVDGTPAQPCPDGGHGTIVKIQAKAGRTRIVFGDVTSDICSPMPTF